jgi:hypothetical protein
VDTTPFVWPPEWNAPRNEDDRAAWWWPVPGRQEGDINGKVFAFLARAGNMIGTAHHNAGLILDGRFVGLRLWAPHDAPDAMLNKIIKTGVWP